MRKKMTGPTDAMQDKTNMEQKRSQRRLGIGGLAEWLAGRG